MENLTTMTVKELQEKKQILEHVRLFIGGYDKMVLDLDVERIDKELEKREEQERLSDEFNRIRMAEMRNAFGAGTIVVNVLTGEQFVV